MTSADLIALLKSTAPTDWPRIWSAVYGHREAAVDAVLRELEAALRAPDATRQSVLRHVRRAAREVVERGPESAAGPCSAEDHAHNG